MLSRLIDLGEIVENIWLAVERKEMLDVHARQLIGDIIDHSLDEERDAAMPQTWQTRKDWNESYLYRKTTHKIMA